MNDADLAEKLIDSGFLYRLHAKMRLAAVEAMVSAKPDNLLLAQARVRAVDEFRGEVVSLANSYRTTPDNG